MNMRIEIFEAKKVLEEFDRKILSVAHVTNEAGYPQKITAIYLEDQYGNTYVFKSPHGSGVVEIPKPQTEVKYVRFSVTEIAGIPVEIEYVFKAEDASEISKKEDELTGDIFGEVKSKFTKEEFTELESI